MDTPSRGRPQGPPPPIHASPAPTRARSLFMFTPRLLLRLMRITTDLSASMRINRTKRNGSRVGAGAVGCGVGPLVGTLSGGQVSRRALWRVRHDERAGHPSHGHAQGAPLLTHPPLPLAVPGPL